MIKLRLEPVDVICLISQLACLPIAERDTIDESLQLAHEAVEGYFGEEIKFNISDAQSY